MDFVKTRSIGKGEKLFREREMSPEIYFLRVGTLLILKGEILVGQLKPTCFVGGLGPVLNIPRSATVMAKTAASLDVYDGREMMARLTVQSDLGVKFLRSLSERFDMIRDKVNDYQYQVLGECLKILSVHVSEKKVAEKKMEFGDIKLVRRELEVTLGQAITRKDAVEDYAGLNKMAKQYGVTEKFEKGVATRFKSFAPIDLKPYKIPRFETYPDFKSAAQSIAQKIIELIRRLTEFHALNLPRPDSEMVLIEESMPFAMREQILKELMLGKYAKGSLDEFKRSVTEFDRTVKALAEEHGHSDMALGSVARHFGLDEPYYRLLQTKWKEFLMK